MSHISVVRHEPGDPPLWPELMERLQAGDPTFRSWMGNETGVACGLLIGGMVSGRSSVTFRVDHDGETLLFEVPLEMLKHAVTIMQAMDGR